MQQIEEHYNRLSRFYEFSDWFFETFRYSKIRPIVWSYAHGAVLDLGMGTGLNIPYYPLARFKKIVGVDLSEGMLRKAKEKAGRLGISMDFHNMDATHLRFPDNSFNTVVSTFLFCVLPNEAQPQALSEARRILKNGGQLVLLEYTYSQDPLKKWMMKILSPYVRWMYKAGFDRKTAEFLGRNGDWKIEVDRFVYKDIIRLMVARKI